MMCHGKMGLNVVIAKTLTKLQGQSGLNFFSFIS